MPLATEEALRLFARRLLRQANKGDVEVLLSALQRSEPVLARLLREAVLHAYLTSARTTARPALPSALSPAGDFSGGPPLRPPFGPVAFGAEGEGDDGAPIRYPGIEAAARWLRSRQLVTPSQLEGLDDQARRTAFTVARTATVDAVGRVREAVTDAFERGGSLREFREAVKGSLDESMLSPARVETLYRTHVGQAQAAGQRAAIEHPLVQDEFPYVLFSATHDSRTRPDHLAMEHHGQNGTAVYRADDPIWETLWPPMSYSCRCSVVPLTVEDAAAHGSKEAQRWLRTGVAPVEKHWARTPYPVTPPPGWTDHRGIVAVV